MVFLGLATKVAANAMDSKYMGLEPPTLSRIFMLKMRLPSPLLTIRLALLVEVGLVVHLVVVAEHVVLLDRGEPCVASVGVHIPLIVVALISVAASGALAGETGIKYVAL